MTPKQPTQPLRVSVHGGHSGQFCLHAADTLEAIVQAYSEKGYAWVGITEHMPPVDDRFLYPEERQAGLTTERLDQRFEQYMSEARRLKEKYKNRMEILVAFETEGYSGSLTAVKRLVARFRPDFFVGSLHHLFDIPFDYSPDEYERARSLAGSVTSLYCRYFDRQLDLIEALRPPVVGHFDLIRIFDRDYSRTLRDATVWQRIERNLKRIADLGLILDFNTAALRKGAGEPYLSEPVLIRARELGIAVVPGDDSHGIDTVGAGFAESVSILKRLGFPLQWAKPGQAV